VPSSFTPGRTLPLTLLLHSLALRQYQFVAIDPRLLHEVCEGRDSMVIAPLARGPSNWYFGTGGLNVWEVWARVAEQFGTDPNRTVISGYSMGGYAAYQPGHPGRPEPRHAVRPRRRHVEAAGERPLAAGGAGGRWHNAVADEDRPTQVLPKFGDDTSGTEYGPAQGR